MEQVDDPDGAGEQLVGDVPDPRRAVAEHHAAGGTVEAAPAGLAFDAPGERREFRVGVPRGGALDGRGVAHRAGLPLGEFAPVGVGRARPDRDQLDFPGAGRAVGLLAGAAGEFRPAHRHAGAVHAQVHGRCPARLGLDHIARRRPRSRGRAPPRCAPPAWRRRSRRRGRGAARPSPRSLARAAARPVMRTTPGDSDPPSMPRVRSARVKARVAGRTVVVRALQAQRAQHRGHRLRAPPGVAGAAAAVPAPQPWRRPVAAVRVQPPLHEPRRQAQRRTAASSVSKSIPSDAPAPARASISAAMSAANAVVSERRSPLLGRPAPRPGRT